MGLIGGLLGHTSEVDPQKIQEKFAPILAQGERVEKVYQLIRDLFVFTDKRFVLVDKQSSLAPLFVAPLFVGVF